MKQIIIQRNAPDRGPSESSGIERADLAGVFYGHFGPADQLDGEYHTASTAGLYGNVSVRLTLVNFRKTGLQLPTMNW